MFNESRVAGSFVTSSQVACIAPPHAEGTYPVEITNNNQDYTSDGITYTYDCINPVALQPLTCIQIVLSFRHY